MYRFVGVERMTLAISLQVFAGDDMTGLCVWVERLDNVNPKCGGHHAQ
jgi:hypothetical protein